MEHTKLRRGRSMALLLLIDEERDACYLAKRILSHEGHVIEAFTHTKEALEWLKRNSPDLAIAGTGKHGEKAANIVALLQGAGINGSRIILSAEMGDLGSMRRAFAGSVLEVIEKGNGFERLLEVIRTARVGERASES
jgi:DNA-binding NtrC family response regulator